MKKFFVTLIIFMFILSTPVFSQDGMPEDLFDMDNFDTTSNVEKQSKKQDKKTKEKKNKTDKKQKKAKTDEEKYSEDSKREKAIIQQQIDETQPIKDVDYEKIFNELQDVQVKFINNEDPDEYYDTQKLYFSPYPLIRITNTLYVRNLQIKPGFYLLTPREYDGKKVVLFKEGGKISYMVPVFDSGIVDVHVEYQKPPKKWWQIRDRYNFQTAYYEKKVRAYDLYGDFYEIDLYYKTGLYKMIFKKNPY